MMTTEQNVACPPHVSKATSMDQDQPEPAELVQTHGQSTPTTYNNYVHVPNKGRYRFSTSNFGAALGLGISLSAHLIRRALRCTRCHVKRNMPVH